MPLMADARRALEQALMVLNEYVPALAAPFSPYETALLSQLKSQLMSLVVRLEEVKAARQEVEHGLGRFLQDLHRLGEQEGTSSGETLDTQCLRLSKQIARLGL